jgi:hypothetical protein
VPWFLVPKLALADFSPAAELVITIAPPSPCRKSAGTAASTVKYTPLSMTFTASR